jgi:5-methylcytosine-specific restriction endonuclease McrA
MIKDKKQYPLKEVFDKIILGESWNKPRRIMFDDDLIKINSLRLQVFKLKGVKCQDCGIEGKYFRKDKFNKTDFFHFNLYAIDSNGCEVLMTKDHIHPKSKGGRDRFDNFQVLCSPCNLKKGDTLQ